MLWLDYRFTSNDTTYAYISDVDEIPLVIEWLKKQEAKMRKLGKKSNTVLDVRAEEK